LKGVGRKSVEVIFVRPDVEPPRARLAAAGPSVDLCTTADPARVEDEEAFSFFGAWREATAWLPTRFSRGRVSFTPGGRPRRLVTLQREHAASTLLILLSWQPLHKRFSKKKRLSAALQCSSVAQPHVRIFQMSAQVHKESMSRGDKYGGIVSDHRTPRTYLAHSWQ